MSKAVVAEVTNAQHSEPNITIGLPVYNGAAYIEEALAALLEQSYRNFTLVISDNASDDGTWDILQRWAARDDRIVLHRQKTNIGMVRNFRYVLDQADTVYFTWQAHDDLLEPNYLEELVRVMTSDPGCGLACGGKTWLKPDVTTPGRREPFRQKTGSSRCRRVAYMLRHPHMGWFSGLYRTEEARRAQGFAEEFGYVWANDRLTVLWFILNDTLRGTDRTTFYKRRTTSSVQTYRPRRVTGQVRFVWGYLRLHFRMLRASRLPLGEKLLLLPWLMFHATRTTGLGHYKRFFKYPFYRFVKRPIKRLVKASTSGSVRAPHGRRSEPD